MPNGHLATETGETPNVCVVSSCSGSFSPENHLASPGGGYAASTLRGRRDVGRSGLGCVDRRRSSGGPLADRLLRLAARDDRGARSETSRAAGPTDPDRSGPRPVTPRAGRPTPSIPSPCRRGIRRGPRAVSCLPLSVPFLPASAKSVRSGGSHRGEPNMDRGRAAGLAASALAAAGFSGGVAGFSSRILLTSARFGSAFGRWLPA